LMEKKGAAIEPPPKEAKIFRFRDKPVIAPGKPPGPGGNEAAPEQPAAASPPPSAAVAPATPSFRDYTKYADEQVLPEAGAETAAPAETANGVAPPTLPAEGTAAVTSKPVPIESRPYVRTVAELPEPRRLPGIGYWALTLVVGVVAFAVGQQTSGVSRGSALSQNAATSQTRPWSLGDLTQLDHVLDADQAGDLDGAERLANSLKAEAGPLPGLEAYLTVIVARRQRLADAQSTLSRMLSPDLEGLELSTISSGLAFTYSRERRFQLASQMFERAALAEPFAAENFRRWGESLRREGHLPQAVAAFRQALARYPVGAVEFMDARQYVEYKIRLSQVEGSLPVDTRTEAVDRDATADTNGFWFLSDAAAALQRGDGAAAAASLQEAKAVLPTTLFDRLLGDYFFRAFASQGQVTAFFPATPNPSRNLRSRQVYFIDP
jgi:tetratricopeptide (TPR) repeat protein